MQHYLKAIRALIYTGPVKFLRGIFSQKTLSKLTELLHNPDQSDELKAFSAALGIFLGILPIWGLQTLAAIFLAILFKLNKPLVVIFSQVSFPPIFPLIIFLSFKVGACWMDKPVTGISFSTAHLGSNMEQYLYGSMTLAVAAGIVTGLLTFGSLKLTKYIKQYRIASRLKKAV